MLKLFKKKQKVEQPQVKEFPYTLITVDGKALKCLGRAIDKSELAFHLSDCLEKYKNMYFTSVDGGKFVLWTKEIYSIKID